LRRHRKFYFDLPFPDIRTLAHAPVFIDPEVFADQPNGLEPYRRGQLDFKIILNRQMSNQWAAGLIQLLARPQSPARFISAPGIADRERLAGDAALKDGCISLVGRHLMAGPRFGYVLGILPRLDPVDIGPWLHPMQGFRWLRFFAAGPTPFPPGEPVSVGCRSGRHRFR